MSNVIKNCLSNFCVYLFMLIFSLIKFKLTIIKIYHKKMHLQIYCKLNHNLITTIPITTIHILCKNMGIWNQAYNKYYEIASFTFHLYKKHSCNSKAVQGATAIDCLWVPQKGLSTLLWESWICQSEDDS